MEIINNILHTNKNIFGYKNYIIPLKNITHITTIHTERPSRITIKNNSVDVLICEFSIFISSKEYEIDTHLCNKTKEYSDITEYEEGNEKIKDIYNQIYNYITSHL